MPIGHPSEYFLRYTLAQAWGDDDQDVTLPSLNLTLGAFGLLGLDEETYDRLRGSFLPPEGFLFHNRRHQATKQWMEDQKIYTLWKPTGEDKRVLPEIIDGHRLVQHDIQLLLLGFIPHDVIAEKVNTKYRLSPEFTGRMIAMYSHYFWNVSLAGQEQWDNLLAGKRYRDAFMSALLCGEQQALYRAGFNPVIDGDRGLREAYRQAYFRLEALRHKPDSRVTTAAFSQLTARLTSIHDILYSQGSGLQDQLKQFRQIMMKHKDPAVKAADELIDRLKGGSYSGDGSDEDNNNNKGDRDE